MNLSIAQLLKHFQLNVTDSRIKILEMFHASSVALAHADIEKQTKDVFDRVTIYRTLQIFLEKGIIHNIPTADNSIRYALCKDNCSEGNHQDKHVHFICDNCNTTFCLANTIIPAVEVEIGFKQKQIDVVVSGICKNCNTES